MKLIKHPQNAVIQALHFFAIFIFILMILPLLYLIIKGVQADSFHTIIDVVFRWRNLELLKNSILLVFLVLLLTTLIAFPLAWLLACSNIKAKPVLLILCVLPLSIPGYVMAYALIGLGGYYGFVQAVFDVRFFSPKGLLGATWALSLYTYPYIFLPVYNSLKSLDGSLENSARSLGYSRKKTFFSIILPNIFPALVSGWLIVALYTLGDFGAVSLMQLDVFSSAIYEQYASGFDSYSATWLALILLILTAITIIVFRFLPQKTRLEKMGIGSRTQPKIVALGLWTIPAWILMILVFLCALGLPFSVIIFWMTRAPLEIINIENIIKIVSDTVFLAIPAACIITIVAILMAVKISWYLSRASQWQEKSIYFAYAIPSLPLALSIAFFTLLFFPVFYQSYPILILAYCISFLALAYGSVRNGLIQTGRQLHYSSLSLGVNALPSFMKITLPSIKYHVISAMTLTFLLIIKELPITYLLAPAGISTLSKEIFSYTNEGMMFEAAPYALILILISSCFIGFVLRNKTDDKRQ